MAYRDLSACLERIERLESENASLRRPRVEWLGMLVTWGTFLAMVAVTFLVWCLL